MWTWHVNDRAGQMVAEREQERFGVDPRDYADRDGNFTLASFEYALAKRRALARRRKGDTHERRNEK